MNDKTVDFLVKNINRNGLVREHVNIGADNYYSTHGGIKVIEIRELLDKVFLYPKLENDAFNDDTSQGQGISHGINYDFIDGYNYIVMAKSKLEQLVRAGFSTSRIRREFLTWFEESNQKLTHNDLKVVLQHFDNWANRENIAKEDPKWRLPTLTLLNVKALFYKDSFKTQGTTLSYP
ncbi:hypothetical protein, partial [Facilibium subflavum]|uniref:hypothetical protein n=1 Tax=Facilibium subflavum TaxID=2219058 RepID=UPI0013C2C682